jgi:hypothetical protein
MLASQAPWERIHFVYDGVGVDVFVPAGGRAPVGPPQNLSAAKSGYLANRQYGWTRDYSPKLWLVAFCMKRLVSAGAPLTSAGLNADLIAVDKQYASDLGIKKGTVGIGPVQWQPIVLGQRMWFTDPTLTTADLYVTALSPSTLLEVSGVNEGADARTRTDYRMVVERVAARVVFAQGPE